MEGKSEFIPHGEKIWPGVYVRGYVMGGLGAKEGEQGANRVREGTLSRSRGGVWWGRTCDVLCRWNL